MSAKVIPLRKLEPANAAPSRPWIRGEVFSRDGVDYELVTVGEIQSVEPCSLQPPETLARVVRSREAGDEVTGVKGQICPRCSAFATIEPGGLRCSRCGYTPIFKRILPTDHWLSGRDWRNRERQRALDRALAGLAGLRKPSSTCSAPPRGP